jgi:hypothetical protein
MVLDFVCPSSFFVVVKIRLECVSVIIKVNVMFFEIISRGMRGEFQEV